MRRFLMALLLVGGALAARAQDAAAVAAQQASQSATQATMQANQQASDAALRASQQAMQNAQDAASMNTRLITDKPKFSMKPGTYSGPQQVFLTDRTRHATIYYTTNGWTPTTNSKRYTGPITVEKTERVQAIAVAPGFLRSQVSVADYTLTGAPATVGMVVVPDGVLWKGTRIPLVFASDVSSSTANVGDPIQLRLAREMLVRGRTIAPDSAEATGVVTAVHKPGLGGQPGELTFELDTVKADGVVIPVFGEETLEGKDHFYKGQILVVVYGGDAEIKPDTPVVATVVADTKLP
ncbi:MAG TPA: chitobiase/beta-hexosaminidase C-terminal domain-containing protein [Acidobacteriaceae bacterium]|nr:chitobiase/beta-hexosaminidase C-terminal domain-containing protein [Acidobacteriaceae bacterium]